ncbi:DUF3117 domain-containing protein [Streptomyces sp. 5-8]|uniref:DUF3117 domain-containing protein n=1 Tax=Streptomyces musisoli TaxID=2802280 RepID=A0ABS1NX44_9ACTN|nr:DUF3117 domain-containing protein [Streptomyces musisoli]MBY8840552.1 DUF3117 domain-containing protein [Streptomyces sp. SP2-10]
MRIPLEGGSRLVVELTPDEASALADELRNVGNDDESTLSLSAKARIRPRTGDGPLEVTQEGQGVVMRIPLEGGGRIVVELTPDEASVLADELNDVGG